MLRHTVVYHEKGMFGGWPANGGVWSWGNEILVSYNVGKYLFLPNNHCIDRSTIVMGLARSVDGGGSWTSTTVEGIFGDDIRSVPEEGHVFSHPDFVLRVGMPGVAIRGDRYVVSYDRGYSWEGPYGFPGLEGSLTSRTCYCAEGPKSLRAFLSRTVPDADGIGSTDVAFAANTTDGGKSWEKLGDMTHDRCRSVMPDVVSLADGALVAALRRKDTTYVDGAEKAKAAIARGEKPQRKTENWIGVVRSTDGGLHWSNEVRAADSAPGRASANGNPPAMRQLPDGRLVLVYGYRGVEPSIRVKVSSDGGETWSMPMILRDDPGNDHDRASDIGYPRLVVRPDGKLVAIYYYLTRDMPEQHIEATIFEV